MRNDGVIEISSSPEPLDGGPTTRSRTKTPGLKPATAKGKAGTPRRRAIPTIVLDLTDSEPEIIPTMKKWSFGDGSGSGSQPRPQNIRRHSETAPGNQAGSSRSSGNIPTSSSKKTTALPLFLPSDEENEPLTYPNRSPAVHDDDVVDEIPISFNIRDNFLHDLPDVPVPPVATVVVNPEPDFGPSIDPEAQQEPELDAASTAIARVLEIVPNVDPDYLLGLVQTYLDIHGAQTVEHVLHLLLEDPKYPKVDPRKKGKGKRKLDEQESTESGARKKAKVDYRSVERLAGGPNYFQLALDQLAVDFAHIPKLYLRRQLSDHRGFYAPAFFTITAQERRFEEEPDERPYQVKATRKSKSKGKRRVMEDFLFTDEREWVVREVQGDTVGAFSGQEDDDEEGDIECQCCYSEYSFAKMVQCPEAHLFCSSCVITYTSNKLGSYDASIVCMHPSGCTLPFPVSELRRVLPEKLMSLYERVKQQKEVEQAGLEGLEECPFCEWKAVFEVSKEEDKLFRCGNEDSGCGVVSCRGCRKEDHLPKSCEEAEKDKDLDGQHVIEEAMTKALTRNCPKCHRAFVKDYGCNRMTCPYCGTPSCYVCRQAITDYDHFGSGKGKCPASDSVERRHIREVKQAAKRAMEEYKRDHPEFDQNAIKVDIPVAQPKPTVPTVPGYVVPAFGLGMGGMGFGYGGPW